MFWPRLSSGKPRKGHFEVPVCNDCPANDAVGKNEIELRNETVEKCVWVLLVVDSDL